MHLYFFKKSVFRIGIVVLLAIALCLVFIIVYKNQPQIKKSASRQPELNTIFKLLDTTYWKNKEINLKLVDKAITIAKQSDNNEAIALALYNKARILYESGQNDSSLTVYNEALNLAQNLKNDTLIARICNGIGNYYVSMDNYYQAMNYFSKAQNISERLGIKRLLGISSNGLGLIYLSLKEYDNAIPYLKKACQIAQELKEIRNGAITNANIGCCYLDKEDYNKALFYNQRSLALAAKNKDSLLILKVSINNGLIYKNTGQSQIALDYFYHSLSFSQRNKDQRLYGTALHNIGSIYKEQGKLDKAKEYLNKSLNAFSESNYKSAEMKSLLLLSEIDSSNGNYKSAYTYYKKYTEVKDSIINGETRKKISELKWQYDLQKKKYEKEIYQKKYEIKKRQNTTLSITLGSLIIIVLMLGSLIRLSHKNLKKSIRLRTLENTHLQEKIEAEKQINRLEKLRYQTEIESKNKELTSSSLLLIAKHEIMTGISNLVEKNVSNKADPAIIIKDLKNILKQNVNQEDEWTHFKALFEEVHQDFFVKLKQICPQLSESELRLCAYLRINIQNKEIAKLLNISSGTVLTSRYRIRKKLKLDNAAILEDFIRNI